jgi:hypothetical protein
MQVRNQHGIEVSISEETWAILVHDRPHEAAKYRRIERSTATSGASDRILLLLHENGIGDVIHAMPAIRAKIESGCRVAVGCTDIQTPLYRRLGCEIIEEKEPTIGVVGKYWGEYGKIYSLRHWCRAHDEETGGDVTVPRFEQFAKYIDATLPETFDWRPYLLPEVESSKPVGNRFKSDIILGLDSTSGQRGYPQHRQLYDELVARHFIVRALGLPGKEADYAEIFTMEGLMQKIDGARTVVAVDAGVLNVALALGKPVVAIMGPTSESIIIDQFSRYRSMDDVSIVRSDHTDDKCLRPCNFSMRRGFNVNNKCNAQADCMKEIGISTIISSLENLWQKNPHSKPLSKTTKAPPVQAPESTSTAKTVKKTPVPRSTRTRSSAGPRTKTTSDVTDNLKLTVLNTESSQ